VVTPAAAAESAPLRTWMCLVCGLVYDEAEGWPEDGIPAGTRWEAVPANWSCPECGARKDDFEMVAI
jgi:rubredoxin